MYLVVEELCIVINGYIFIEIIRVKDAENFSIINKMDLND